MRVRSRYLLPLAYLVVGVTWVVGSDMVLGNADLLDRHAELAASLKGIAFVVASALLLFLVQSWPFTPPPHDTTARHWTARAWRPLLIFLITAVGVAIAGVVLYRQQAQEVRRRAVDAIASNEEFTTRQIELWLLDRSVGLEYAGRNPLLARELVNRRHAPQPAASDLLLAGALDVLRLSEDFERVQVFAPDGTPIATAGGPIRFSSSIARWARGAGVTGRVVVSSAYVPAGMDDDQSAVDFVVAVYDPQHPGEIAGILVARADPVRYVVPTLDDPDAGTQGVSVAIAQREGARFVWLKPRMDEPGGKSTIDFVPLPADSVVGLAVRRGPAGVFETRDRSGRQVLAHGRAVGSTPWFVVATVDRDAVYAPLQQVARLAVLLGLAAMLTSGLMILLWWRSERLEQQQRVAAISAERDLLLQRLQLQFERMASACVVVSNEGRVVQVNPAFDRTFERAAGDVLGRTLAEVSQLPSRPDNLVPRILYLLEHPDENYTGVHENLTSSGRRIVCRWTAAALRTPDGTVHGVIALADDITASIEAGRELQQARDHLEERVAERTRELEAAKDAAEHADRVKSVFLSTMSHELRTPLNSIIGFTDVILQGLSGPLTEAQARQLGIVRDSSAHLRALIEDVLDVSRIEAGQIGLQYDDVDLRELVAGCVDAFRAEAERKGIDLGLEAPAEAQTIRCDRKRTGQIVNNLLSNAVKFTDRGSVTIRIQALPDRMEISVADTGIGIAADALKTLFNPFTQVVRPGGPLHDGAGLGLAISRNLARALGGDVIVTSVAGQGSRFTLWLPRVAVERATADVQSTAVFPRPDVRALSPAT